jgi:hypothetical protein
LKAIGPAILALTAFAFLASTVYAATAAPKRTREACMQLARERGFTGGMAGGGAAAAIMKKFVVDCMNGKQN